MNTVVYILAGCVIVYIIVDSILKTRQYRADRKRRHERLYGGDNRVTRTGETFGERASYHERGELSPGEHALAQAIREHLESTRKKSEDD